MSPRSGSLRLRTAVLCLTLVVGATGCDTSIFDFLRGGPLDTVEEDTADGEAPADDAESEDAPVDSPVGDAESEDAPVDAPVGDAESDASEEDGVPSDDESPLGVPAEEVEPDSRITPGRPADSISVTSHGAIADDGDDDHAAFAAAISAARRQGVAVWVPAGTFRLSNTLLLDGVELVGAGMSSTRLLTTNSYDGAIVLRGDGAGLRDLEHEYESVVSRNGRDLSGSVTVSDARNWRIENVLIDKATTHGILARQSSNGVITGNTIQNTNADAVHMTGGTSFVTISGNTVLNSGDDMYAVVSYLPQGAITHDITIEDNRGSVGDARGISVVGGEDITITGNHVQNTQMASSYIAVERNYNTFDVQRVTLTNNIFEHGGMRLSAEHPTVLVYAGTDGSIDEINYVDNHFTDAVHAGVSVRGSGTVGDVYYTGNTLSGSAGAPTQFQIGTIHRDGNTGF